MEGRQSLGAGWVSGIIQQLVVNMWSDPSVDQLLSRAAHTYTTRRTALMDALAERGIPAHGRSGLNVWIPVPEEAAVVSGLLEHGWAVAAGERWRLETIPARRGNSRTMRTPPAIRVTAATLAAQDARRFADDLAGVLVERRYSA
jgi:DNA-binding transcriptional MocR family regulator